MSVLEEITTAQEQTWRWFMEHARSRYALAWLGLLAFADTIFFPIAPEPFLAALVLAHRDHWRRYLGVALALSTAGAIVGYFIAAFLFDQFGRALIDFYGLHTLFAMARETLQYQVFAAMLIASFTPIPDKVFIYAAGFLGAPFAPFVLGFVLGRGARMSLVVFLVHRFGLHVLKALDQYFWWTAIAVLVIFALYGIVHWNLLPL